MKGGEEESLKSVLEENSVVMAFSNKITESGKMTFVPVVGNYFGNVDGPIILLSSTTIT